MTSPELDDLLAVHVRFCERAWDLDDVPGVDVFVDDVAPVTDARIDLFERTHGLRVPEDVRTFWRGLRQIPSLSVDDPQTPETSGHGGMEWVTPDEYLDRDLPGFRSLADPEDGPLVWALDHHGLPLTYAEPILVQLPDDGALHWRVYDGDTPEYPVAPTFTAFLHDYLGAGCFTGHAFAPYWAAVASIVENPVLYAENRWLQFLERTYPGSVLGA